MISGRMDIERYIEVVDNAIRNGKSAFVIRTEFGKVGIEVSYSDFDWDDPIEIYPWDQAPSTRWTSRTNEHCEYYVFFGIHNSSSNRWIHIRSIEAITKVLFYHTLQSLPAREYIDAAVMSYLENVERRTMSEASMEDEFCRVNLNMFTRNDPVVRILVREMLVNRAEKAKRTLESSHEIFRGRPGIDFTIVNTRYMNDILALIYSQHPHNETRYEEKYVAGYIAMI